jgi:hypothetical protein
MGNIKARLDRLESALGRRQSRVMVYTVGITVPGEEIAAWLQRQKEAGVISEHDLVVGICDLSSEPPSAKWVSSAAVPD